MNVEQTPTGAETLKFVHIFSRSVRCTLSAYAEPPSSGTVRTVSCEWVGRPKPKHTAEYRRWALSVHQTLADRWGKKTLYALGVSPRETELWEFTPGEAPVLIAKIAAGIP